ncbi:hypothetical protein OH492_09490 [Vibrio chagasii]|nr:hypothetical protein [Vibrio chagasii]
MTLSLRRVGFKLKFVNNLMIDMDGERELISIKSGDNTFQATIFKVRH